VGPGIESNYVSMSNENNLCANFVDDLFPSDHRYTIPRHLDTAYVAQGMSKTSVKTRTGNGGVNF
jgi:hypothetical protein